MFMKKIVLISLSFFAFLLLAGCEDTQLDQGPGIGTEAGNNEKIGRPKFSIGEFGWVTLCEDTEGNLFGLSSMK